MKSYHIHYPSTYLAAVCVAFLMLPVTPAEATIISTPMVNPANGHTYYLLDTATWTSSESEAVTLGGHLVTINDNAENNWVYDTFVPLLPTGVVAATLWIGLNDAAQEGTFVWASGEAVTFTNWSIGQPDNARGVEDYAHFWSSSNTTASSVWRQWNDASNDLNFGATSGTPYGIVEIPEAPPVPTVPEPSSLALLASAVANLCVGSIWRRCRRGRHA